MYSGLLGKVNGGTFLLEILDVLCAEMSVTGDHQTILPTHDYPNHVSRDVNYHKLGCNCPSEIVLGNLIVTVRALKPSSIKSL